MSFQLGTLAITANTSAIFQAPDSGVKGILIGNESGLTVTITMESGGVQKTLYPSMLDWFDVRPGFTGNIKIAPTIILNNVSSFPASSLIFDAIGLNDPENASMYPVHMPRNTNVGNGLTVTNNSSISNTGNGVGTQFVNAVTAGDTVNSVSLTNDGQLQLGNKNSANPHNASLGIGSGLNQANQSFQVDGNGNVTIPNGAILKSISNAFIGATGYNLLGVDSSNNGFLTLPNSGVVTSNKVTLTVGSLTRIALVGQTTIANAGTSVSHSLGAIPDFVIPIHDTGGANSDVISINFGTMTSNTFTAYTSNAGGSGNIRFLLIKLT